MNTLTVTANAFSKVMQVNGNEGEKRFPPFFTRRTSITNYSYQSHLPFVFTRRCAEFAGVFPVAGCGIVGPDDADERRENLQKKSIHPIRHELMGRSAHVEVGADNRD